jgi:multidrug efflux pump subunit AcrA (membrane-fusion protein)
VTSVEAGIVEPERKAKLASPVAGRIVRVLFSEGQRVREGEALVELENDTEKVRLEETAKELERVRGLGTVSSADQLDRASFAHRQAQVAYERTFVRAPFDGLIADLNARPGEVTYGSLAIAFNAGKAAEEPLVYMVDDSRLYVEAEIDELDVFRVRVGQETMIRVGSVDRRSVPGRVVSLSSTVSTTEGESRTAEVKAEILRGQEKAGTAARGRVGEASGEARGEARRETKAEARGDAVGPAGADPVDREEGAALPREAVFHESGPAAAGGGGIADGNGSAHEGPTSAGAPAGAPADDAILVGMSADVEIIVDRASDVLRVPTAAILERGAESYVFVLSGDRLVRRVITVGLANWELTQVLGGLVEGDLVVLPAESKSLRDGAVARVVREEEAR